MANNVTTSWFFEDPIDFEYKRYKLLAAIEHAEKMLEEGNIHTAMDFIEDHLVCFYRFQTDQELKSINSSEIVGIDPILMDVIYKKENNEDRQVDIKILSDVAELGIMEFEALHSMFRIKWREIDDSIKIGSYIPKKLDLLSDGVAFLSNESEGWTRIYVFSNPEETPEWKDFRLFFSKEIKYNLENIIEMINSFQEKNKDLTFIQSSINKSFESKTAIDFVLTCKIYYKLKKDYLF